jgi:hypothetical protein
MRRPNRDGFRKAYPSHPMQSRKESGMKDLTEKQFLAKLAENGFAPSLGMVYFVDTTGSTPGACYGAIFKGKYDGETPIDKMQIHRRATLARLLRARPLLQVKLVQETDQPPQEGNES